MELPPITSSEDEEGDVKVTPKKKKVKKNKLHQIESVRVPVESKEASKERASVKDTCYRFLELYFKSEILNNNGF